MSGLATMRAMIELGLSDEQKLILLEAIEADAGPSRSTSAERQRRYRDRKRGITSDVTPLRNGRYVTPPPIEDIHTPSEVKTSPDGEPKETEIVEAAWNAMAERTGLGKIRNLRGSRLAKLRARLRENGLETCLEAIVAVERSPFCLGQVTNWKADFNFYLTPDRFAKLIEGGYDGVKANGQPAGESLLEQLRREEAEEREAEADHGRVEPALPPGEPIRSRSPLAESRIAH